MGAEGWGHACRVIWISLNWQPPLTLQFQRKVPQSLALGEELEALSTCLGEGKWLSSLSGSQIGCPIPSGYSWTHGHISKDYICVGVCVCTRVHVRQREWRTIIKRRPWIWEGSQMGLDGGEGWEWCRCLAHVWSSKKKKLLKNDQEEIVHNFKTKKE